MSKIDISLLKKEIGERFKQMRQALKKSQGEIAGELEANRITIINIENGTTTPRLFYLKYFHEKYHLDMNWLLTGAGERFLEKEENAGPGETGAAVKRVTIPVTKEEDEELYNKYAELNKLIQLPEIETVIFAKMQELKILYKGEIEEFERRQRAGKDEEIARPVNL